MAFLGSIRHMVWNLISDIVVLLFLLAPWASYRVSCWLVPRLVALSARPFSILSKAGVLLIERMSMLAMCHGTSTQIPAFWAMVAFALYWSCLFKVSEPDC